MLIVETIARIRREHFIYAEMIIGGLTY